MAIWFCHGQISSNWYMNGILWHLCAHSLHAPDHKVLLDKTETVNALPCHLWYFWSEDIAIAVGGTKTLVLKIRHIFLNKTELI